MKNEEHPLISALRPKSKMGGMDKMPDMPRVLEVREGDMPIMHMNVGDEVEVTVKGTVSSVHKDGTMMMDVKSIEPCEDEESEEDGEPTEVKEPPIVRLDEGHA